MEESEKVRHISQQEAKEIDATKVAYFTLNDGTVLLIKENVSPQTQEIAQENIASGEEQQYQINSNQEEEILNQNAEDQNIEGENEQLPEEQELQQNIVSGQENQEEIQIQNQTENQQIITGTENEQINNIQTQSQNTQNTQEIQQQTSNIGYNISSEGQNSEQKNCTCSYNCKLINATNIANTYNAFGRSTYYTQNVGKRRQLYKLVEAIPVRYCDFQGIQLMNQTTNVRLNLQQYNSNTYIAERGNNNYQLNTQSSGNDYQENTQTQEELKFNYNCNEVQQQQQEQQEEEKCCCCPIGNAEMREEYEIVSQEYYEKSLGMKMNKK